MQRSRREGQSVASALQKAFEQKCAAFRTRAALRPRCAKSAAMLAVAQRACVAAQRPHNMNAREGQAARAASTATVRGRGRRQARSRGAQQRIRREGRTRTLSAGQQRGHPQQRLASLRHAAQCAMPAGVQQASARRPGAQRRRRCAHHACRMFARTWRPSSTHARMLLSCLLRAYAHRMSFVAEGNSSGAEAGRRRAFLPFLHVRRHATPTPAPARRPPEAPSAAHYPPVQQAPQVEAEVSVPPPFQPQASFRSHFRRSLSNSKPVPRQCVNAPQTRTSTPCRSATAAPSLQGTPALFCHPSQAREIPVRSE